MNKKIEERVAAPTKFTKAIKEKWLAALKSGDYTQGYGSLEIEERGVVIAHCCIGVLGCVIMGLDNKINQKSVHSPYKFLHGTITEDAVTKFWKVNDSAHKEKGYPGGYINVIPLIQQLPTQD